MAGSSSFPTSQDSFVEKQDGIDIIQADDVNDAYAGVEATQGHVGNTGASQSNSIDILDYIARILPTLKLSFTSATEITVSTGVAFGLNSGESIRLPRKNTSTVLVDTGTHMDTGAIGNNLDYFIHAVFDATATTVTFVISLSSSAPTGITTFQLIGGFSTDGSAQIIEATVFSVAGMRVVGVKNFQTGAVATGTTNTVDDDSIPQNDEGDQFMSLEATAKAAINKWKIQVTWCGSLAGANLDCLIALFQDDIADALAAARVGRVDTGDVDEGVHTFTHFMTTGTISATTFKVRAGNNGSDTTTFNGVAGGRKLGGVMASSITITEYEV